MLKILKYKTNKSLKSLELFLNKRQSIQKNRTSEVLKIINNVRKNGDKEVLK